MTSATDKLVTFALVGLGLLLAYGAVLRGLIDAWSTDEIPILRQGNALILANATLEVAEACSGIRSLVSLFTVASCSVTRAADRPLPFHGRWP